MSFQMKPFFYWRNGSVNFKASCYCISFNFVDLRYLENGLLPDLRGFIFLRQLSSRKGIIGKSHSLTVEMSVPIIVPLFYSALRRGHRWNYVSLNFVTRKYCTEETVTKPRRQFFYYVDYCYLLVYFADIDFLYTYPPIFLEG